MNVFQELYDSMAHNYSGILGHFTFEFVGAHDYWTVQFAGATFNSPSDVNSPSNRAVPGEAKQAMESRPTEDLKYTVQRTLDLLVSQANERNNAVRPVLSPHTLSLHFIPDCPFLFRKAHAKR